MKICGYNLYVLWITVDAVLSDVSSNRISCKTPTIKYGRIRSRQRGRSIRFMCYPSYQLAGERTAFCMPDGTWDEEIPKCVRGTCPKKESSIANGLIITSHGGAVLSFFCQEGFERNGPERIYCDGFKWDNDKPSCLPTNSTPPLFCDFENVDLCHWNHDLNHDMEWMRDNFKTPTGYSMPTGPSFDHTKGNGTDGHYMYLESSSKRVNDTARLISPIFGINGNLCLEFWYHMYGKTTGTLRAYIKPISKSWPLAPSEAKFSKSGNQGDEWYQAIINLGNVSESFQIVMEGVRGDGYVSDIAIDDIKIIPDCVYADLIKLSSTTDIPLMTSQLPEIGSCANRCGYKASSNDTSSIILCDCDVFCYDNSRCCPDFIDMCIILDTEGTVVAENTTPISEVEAAVTETKSKTYTSSKLNISDKTTKKTDIAATTMKPKHATTGATSLIITPRVDLIPPTNESPKVSTAIKTTTYIPTMKSTSDTRRFSKSPTKTTITVKASTQAISHETKTVSPIVIAQSSEKPKITQTVVPSITQAQNSSKIVFMKPNDAKNTGSDYDELSNAVEDYDDDIEEREESIEKTENNNDYIHKIKNIEEIKSDSRNLDQISSNRVYVIIIICAGILLVILGTVAVTRIDFRTIIRKRSLHSGQHGDSQCDVRFLTANEVLDFDLSNDDDL